MAPAFGIGRRPSSPPPRFEFRCWGDSLEDAHDRLDSRWHPVAETNQADVYYLGGPDDLTLKSRDGFFQVKERIARHNDLEQWNKVADIRLPAPWEDILPWLQRAFGLSPRAQGEGVVDQNMLNAWLQRQETVTVAPVAKDRRQYRLSVLMAEYTRVEVAGRRMETVAAESPDPEAVAWARRDLGLAKRANESYPTALARILGLPGASR